MILLTESGEVTIITIIVACSFLGGYLYLTIRNHHLGDISVATQQFKTFARKNYLFLDSIRHEEGRLYHMSGDIGKCYFSLSENLSSKKGETTATYKGISYKLNFIIVRKKLFKPEMVEGRTRFEGSNARFNKLYVVYTDDVKKATRILSPSVQSYLCMISNEFAGTLDYQFDTWSYSIPRRLTRQKDWDRYNVIHKYILKLSANK